MNGKAIAIVLGALFAASAASARSDWNKPSASIGKTSSLGRLIQFGPPTVRGSTRGGQLYWRADIDLPRRATLRRVDLRGYAPVQLTLGDGRCFQVDLDSDIDKLTATKVSPVACSPADTTTLSPGTPPRPGLRFVGKAWNLDAWADDAAGTTILVPENAPQQAPVLTTRMKVLAVGGIGSPDAPLTEVSLVGYAGNQLTLATVMLFLP